ncbi:MAG TPA: CHASE2 domain-containing protein [Methylomirabilota bacterium]|nr:CHASE2 domain-containing protein [Methylomirabilota bacterium]
MAAPSDGFWQRRGLFSLYELLQSWWRHRVSFLISIAITFAALALYYLTFFGERPTPFFQFLQRLEFNSLDTRFRSRPVGATPPDPRIVIVEIDQKSQEVLGKWPFPRSNFATMLDVLREDGAKVVAFDVTFDKPDRTADPVRALWAQLEERKNAGEAIDPKLESEVRALAARYDADAKFAQSLQKFGPVVLGNFFLTADQLTGIDPKTLDQYDELIEWFSIGRNALHQESGKEDFAELVARYRRDDLSFAANVANIPVLANPDNSEKNTIGFFNEPSDPDGVVRRSLLVLPFGRSKDINDWQMYGSLEVQAVRLYLGVRSDQVTVQFDQTGVVRIDFGTALYLRTDTTGRTLINYHGPKRTYPYRSVADVVQRKVEPGTFKDKIVLVGASATGIADLRTPPYGENDYPGVEIHANVIDNMLHENFLVRGAKQQLLDGILIVILGVPLGIWMALVSPRWMWFGAFLFVPLVGVDYWAFLHGWWLNFTVPALTLASNVLLVSLYRSLFEEKEKRRVRSAFGQYLSPEVIRRLLVNPRLVDPKKTEITVMFSDIRGFTTISEKLDAQDLALFLNQYLSDMTSLVFDHQGTLDKYIGDAVMAFWGAPFEEPGHAGKACNTALKMMARVREMQKKWEAEGKPHLDIGIGLNTGLASVGNMGSALRYGYTALGDSVNLSSRLEGLNKDYGTHILVNETTYAAAQEDGFVFRELDLIRVKGKLQPVTIYELIGRAGESSIYGTTNEVGERLELFRLARALYSQRQWADAQKGFQAILDRWPDDGPSRAYWKRCQDYLFEEPPSGWDGVFTMTHK